MHVTSPILLLHICGAIVGLLSGAVAMVLRKGSGLHAAAGNVFFVSMLVMSSSAWYVAAFLRPNKVNFIVAILTFYLVTTAWVAARRRDGRIGMFDRVALLVVLADGVFGVILGLQAANNPLGGKVSAALYFIFGSIALLCAALDARMIKRGGFVGGKRIARHLLRMCFALLITTFSLYPGQAKLFPAWIRATNLMYIPHVLLIGSMIFWTVRVRRLSIQKRAAVAATARLERTESAWPEPATSAARN